MLRSALAALLVSLVLPAAAVAAEGTVALTLCAPDERAAEFEARMTRGPAAARVKMRFLLEARRPGSRRFRRVPAPGFSPWTGSRAAIYRFTRRVEPLTGPAAYRVQVRFRWLDRRGRTVGRDRAYSRACSQPDHRPNLRLRSLSVTGRRHSALVANTGRTATGPFELRLAGAGAGSVTVESLEPGTQRLVEIDGPRCSDGETATVVADPLDLLDERFEGDNSRTVTCE